MSKTWSGMYLNTMYFFLFPETFAEGGKTYSKRCLSICIKCCIKANHDCATSEEAETMAFLILAFLLFAGIVKYLQ